MQYNGRQTDTHTHTDVSCVKCFLSFYTAAPLQPATHVSGKTWSKLLGNQTEPHRAFWLAVKVEKKHLTASNSKLSLCATSQPNMSSTFLCVAATQNLSTSLLFTPTDEMCHLTLPMEYGTLKKKRERDHFHHAAQYSVLSSKFPTYSAIRMKLGACFSHLPPAVRIFFLLFKFPNVFLKLKRKLRPSKGNHHQAPVHL